MDYTVKPSWLTNPDLLYDIANNYISIPESMSSFTNLPAEQSIIAGLRHFLYWKGQLLPSSSKTTIFLAFLGPSGLIKVNVDNVMKALGEVVDLSLVEELYQGANTCFVALSFAASHSIDNITSKFLFYNNNIVLSFSTSSTQQHRFRLTWLPPRFNIDRVHHLIQSFSSSHQLHRENIHLAGNLSTPSNTIAGTITLKPGGHISQLPYLIQLPSPHKGCALLTLESRPPLCLKCHAIGHTRPQCPMVKCSSCLKVHFPDAPCGYNSYSEVAGKNISSFSSDDWMAQLPDNTNTVPLPSSSSIIADADNHIHPINSSLPSPHSSNIASDQVQHVPFISPDPIVSECVRTPCINMLSASECGRTFRVSSDASPHLNTSSPSNTAVNNSYSSYQCSTTNTSFLSSNLITSNIINNSSPPASAINNKNLLTLSKDVKETEDVLSSLTASNDTSSCSNNSRSHKKPRSSTSKNHKSSSELQCTSPTPAEYNPDLISTSLSDTAPVNENISHTSSPHMELGDFIPRKRKASTFSQDLQPNSSEPTVSFHDKIKSSPIDNVSSSACQNNTINITSASQPPSPHFNPLLLIPNPNTTVSECEIICPSCLSQQLLPWPIDGIYACTDCEATISEEIEGRFTPHLSKHPILLSLIEDTINDPHFIEFIQWCESKNHTFLPAHDFKPP